MQYVTLDTLRSAPREFIIAWLSWNDKNGVYRDAECIAEFLPILTRDEALNLAIEQFNGGN